MKRFLTLALSLVALSGVCQAASIVWGAGISNGLSLANGTNLGIGSLARIGTFDITDGVIAANATNVAFLSSHFIEFGTARIGDGFNFAEHFSASSTANSGSTGLNIAGAQIYLWTFASTDNSSIANSIATATQSGIFYLDKSVNPAWAVPAQDPVPGSTSVDLADLTNAAATSLISGAHVVVGTFPDGTSDQTGKPNFGLAVVPEPSVALAALTSIGVIALRRRRHS